MPAASSKKSSLYHPAPLLRCGNCALPMLSADNQNRADVFYCNNKYCRQRLRAFQVTNGEFTTTPLDGFAPQPPLA